MSGGTTSSHTHQDSSLNLHPTLASNSHITIGDITTGGNTSGSSGSATGAHVKGDVGVSAMPLMLQNLQYHPEHNMVTAQVQLL